MLFNTSISLMVDAMWSKAEILASASPMSRDWARTLSISQSLATLSKVVRFSSFREVVQCAEHRPC